ncbi:ABC transporter ATP-binding protein [Rhodoligotrophos ferricapiens]|uniref:ABC transporter ATP-binding protein n=1 Tax=Rhodoligotrophos ferricapiens TaxID=3069264 RepID=UPI00315D2593
MPDQPDRNAIEVRGVSKIFPAAEGPVKALDGIFVDIRENEFFTLLGPSGCGKTTLLRMIAGFEFPTTGEILLHGEDIAPLPPYRRPVNTVFQNYALFPHMTVAENIAFGLQMLGRPKAEVEARVSEMLRLVKMEPLRNRKTSQISGGQQQRVALARALAPSPKVLLLDEPLSALDYKLRKEMQVELKRLQRETGITFIFVTHDQEEALTMSNRLAVMSAGRILQVGSPREIYDRPAERFVADFIGETNFLEGEVVSLADGRASVRLKSGLMVDASLPEQFLPSGKVTVVIRPEHAEIVPLGGEHVLPGRVENTDYFGTDTRFDIALDSGERFILRRQNSHDTVQDVSPGDRIGVTIDSGAAQVLKD